VQRDVRGARRPRHLPLDEGLLGRLGDELLGRRRQRELARFDALPPYDSDDDQNVTKVFNGVPWTWLREAGDEAP
jgi:hypothetical protein